MLITTKNKKHIYCYRENGTLATDWFFLDILLDYLFGNTDIDPQYKYGEYQNLSSSQKKQLKKEYEESYETRKNWWKIMPNEDRPRNDFKIKIGKLKVIPNENGEKRPPKALQFTMRVKEKK